MKIEPISNADDRRPHPESGSRDAASNADERVRHSPQAGATTSWPAHNAERQALVHASPTASSAVGFEASGQVRKRPREDTLQHIQRRVQRRQSSRSPEPSSAESSAAHPNVRMLQPADYLPYVALELAYPDIFDSKEICHVAEPVQNQFGAVPDVGMDKIMVVNTATDKIKTIGTSGVASCIAVLARSQNSEGQTILGMCHSSGLSSTNDVLGALHGAMLERGAFNPEMYLVGGMIQTSEEGGGSLKNEQEFLALNEEFNIKGAKLHLSKGEVDPVSGELNGVNVVLSATSISYSEKSMFDEDTGGVGEQIWDVADRVLEDSESDASSSRDH